MREFGVIGEDVSSGTEVSVKLKYIDPIYAITNEPKLSENVEFMEHERAYADEMKVVTDVVAQQDEHVREWKRHHHEMRLR